MTTKTLRGFPLEESFYWSFLALEDLARQEGWVKQSLDLYQGIGYSSKSGGTHAPPGGSGDFWQSANPAALLRAARNGGLPGWHRVPGQGFAHHIHAGVKGLPGRPYNYQITALLAGYNGLGAGGRGGRDDGPRDGVVWRDWADGLAWLRAQIKTPEPPKVVQELRDFWNGWQAVQRWDAADGDTGDVVLYGISDADLIARLGDKGFGFYGQPDPHERARFLLADFVQGMALEDVPRSDNEAGWDALNRVLDPAEPGITWVELRPAFDAAHSGGGFGAWGEQRVRHSVRAIQAGLTELGSPVVEDGIYGPRTRDAVADFQVHARGARAGTAAADGVVGIHDFLHLVGACSRRTGRMHRARFLY